MILGFVLCCLCVVSLIIVLMCRVYINGREVTDTSGLVVVPATLSSIYLALVLLLAIIIEPIAVVVTACVVLAFSVKVDRISRIITKLKVVTNKLKKIWEESDDL